MPKKKKYGYVLSRRGLSAGLQVGSTALVADNSGAKEVMIIDVPLVKNRIRRLARAAISDLVVVTIKKGTPQVRKQISYAVVVRQKRPYKRFDGTWISFSDNAVVLVNPDGTPKASEIRGTIPKEVGERWPSVAKLATSII
ncbi:MAG: 50S ribosomal protein L14 [Caldisphaeraceae archaeon]|nr:50S ribosomal protein L14 [Caldisphaeraceae archaeon]